MDTQTIQYPTAILSALGKNSKNQSQMQEKPVILNKVFQLAGETN